jgi:16S rRNA (adenine1518-N6/adenine1519-N6)-dimethyltransferase
MNADAPAWEDPRAVLARHGLRAKRGYSQNFLISQRAVDTIAAATVIDADMVVVELGAGLGTLTSALLRAGTRVIAIERDPDMLRVLEAELGAYRLEVRREDAAALDYAALAQQIGGPPGVAGNLPYAITGPILRNLVEHRRSLAHAVVMVQREVRNRLVAQPGTGDYGALTVFTQAAFAVDTVLKLGAGAFHPRPRVESAVVRLKPRAVPLAEETPAFRRTVRAAFQSRRKTLRNALATTTAPALASRALTAAGIDPDRRGETLSVQEFACLAAALESTEQAG